MKTFRFHYHGWVDIQAEDIDEAMDKYNDGEYDDDPTLGNFENDEVEELD